MKKIILTVLGIMTALLVLAVMVRPPRVVDQAAGKETTMTRE